MPTLFVSAVADGRGENDILLPRMTPQQRGNGGEKQHVNGRAGAACEIPQQAAPGLSNPERRVAGLRRTGALPLQIVREPTVWRGSGKRALRISREIRRAPGRSVPLCTRKIYVGFRQRLERSDVVRCQCLVK